MDAETKTVDLANMLIRMFKELAPMATDIRGKPPKELREWYKEEKAKIKLQPTQEAEERKREAAEAKAAAKAAKAGDGDGDETSVSRC